MSLTDWVSAVLNDYAIEVLTPLIGSASINVWKHWRNRGLLSTREDLAQEGWVWVLGHPDLVERILGQEEGDPRKYLYVCVARRMRSYCETKTAQRAGYEKHDQFFYDLTLLGTALPYALDTDITSHYANPLVQAADHDAGRGVSDPSKGNNWMAMCADIARAYETLGGNDRGLLRDMYVHPLGANDAESVRFIAERMGLSARQVYRRREAALQNLVIGLGGEKYPKDEREAGAFDPDERPVTFVDRYAARRMAKGNATALTELRREYEGV